MSKTEIKKSNISFINFISIYLDSFIKNKNLLIFFTSMEGLKKQYVSLRGLS